MSVYLQADWAGNDYPLNHPRIAWSNAARRATITASTEAAGFDAINAGSPWTYNFWKPTSATSQWELELDATESIAACGIDAHTLGTAGATVQVQSSDDGAAWSNVGPSVTPADDAPILILFARAEMDYVRLSITGGTPTIGVIMFSDVIELPQKVYAGVKTPVDMARRTDFNTNRTTGGQYVGRSIKRQKKDNDFTVQHLHESYVRATLEPFIEDAISYPYFLAERPLGSAGAVSYRWRDQDILPERMGVLDFMQVTL